VKLDLPHTDAYVNWVSVASKALRQRPKRPGANDRRPLERKARPGAATPTDAPVSRDTAKQRTREALVAAALELFAAEGLDAPSLDAICERAGYTRGAFYVHFRDRDELLVAAMEKVGEAFLGRLFQTTAETSENLENPNGSALAAVTQRFVRAVAEGTYPLMPRADDQEGAGAVRPHQLLDACARSAIVRARYAALVEASIGQIAELARVDQAAGLVRRELGARDLGTILLALVVGAQTMAEIGVAIDADALARTVLSMASQRNG
jgi:TetR/AcrR family transcriptional regulator, transcriptional repressor for nem operon